MQKDFRVIGSERLVRAFIGELEEKFNCVLFEGDYLLDSLNSEEGYVLTFRSRATELSDTVSEQDLRNLVVLRDSIAGLTNPLLELPRDWDAAIEIARNRLGGKVDRTDQKYRSFGKVDLTVYLKEDVRVVDMEHDDRSETVTMPVDKLVTFIKTVFETDFFGDTADEIKFGCTVIDHDTADRMLEFLS